MQNLGDDELLEDEAQEIRGDVTGRLDYYIQFPRTICHCAYQTKLSLVTACKPPCPFWISWDRETRPLTALRREIWGMHVPGQDLLEDFGGFTAGYELGREEVSKVRLSWSRCSFFSWYACRCCSHLDCRREERIL